MTTIPSGSNISKHVPQRFECIGRTYDVVWVQPEMSNTAGRNSIVNNVLPAANRNGFRNSPPNTMPPVEKTTGGNNPYTRTFHSMRLRTGEDIVLAKRREFSAECTTGPDKCIAITEIPGLRKQINMRDKIAWENESLEINALALRNRRRRGELLSGA